MRPFLFALLCLLPAVTLPAAADPVPAPHPSSLRSDILYTHKGEFVQVSPMRPLTLNAHVEQFQYDPLGLEIAYIGSEPQGENMVHFVKTVDVRTGRELSRLTLTAPTSDDQASFRLLGWSVSGKYLLLERFMADPQDAGKAVTEYLRWDLSANPSVAQVIDPSVALPVGSMPESDGSSQGSASPDGRWMAFKQHYHELDAGGEPGPDMTFEALYNVEGNTFQPLALPPKTEFQFWIDSQHLFVLQQGDRKQFNIITGQISPIAKPLDFAPSAVSKQYPDLSLEVEQRSINSETDRESVKETGGSVESVIIWIRRSPYKNVPLGVAAAGLMPVLYNNSQAVWSPTGRQVAFIANDDLCVTTLVAATDPLPHEKMAVGLKLSCEEEQQMAMSNLKQIGLALIQYSQDFDEHYPPTEDIEKTIYPYLKTTDVFSVGSTHWVYHGASNVSLASIDAPADTVQATMDLPCAHLVLYFDGHVKAYPKQDTMP